MNQSPDWLADIQRTALATGPRDLKLWGHIPEVK